MIKSRLIPVTVLFLGMTIPVTALEDVNDSNNSNKKNLPTSTWQLAQKTNKKPVIVYGRPTCGFTTHMIEELKARKIAYQFKNIDTPVVLEELNQLEFESDIRAKSIRLPYVYVNGKLLASPNSVSVQQVINQLSVTQKPTKISITQPVVIYSTSNDQYTAKIIKGLQTRNIPYQFYDVDSTGVEEKMWSLLQQNGFTQKSVKLPIVQVNNKMMIQPTMQQVLTQQ